MAAREVLALNESTPQILAPQSGDTYSMPRGLTITPSTGSALTLTGGTVTTSNPLVVGTQTWNAAGVTFTGWSLAITSTASAAASKAVDITVGGTSILSLQKDGYLALGAGYFHAGNGVYTGGAAFNSATCSMGDTSGEIKVANTGNFAFSSTSGLGASDTKLVRTAASIMGLRNGTTGGAALSMVEQTAPSAPAANGVYIYAEDNGAGKTRLMALFATGAAQQIAIEP